MSPAPTGNLDEVILVVEDETKVRHMAVDALRALGYTVVQAGSPSEGLQQLALQPSITLVFTDIVLPEMTGREMIDRMKADKPKLKVVYTTGYICDAVV